MGQTLYLEIGTEEIPAGYIVPALESMSVRMSRFLDENRIAHGEPIVAGTPRRLVLNVPDVAHFAAACNNGGHSGRPEAPHTMLRESLPRLPKGLRKGRA